MSSVIRILTKEEHQNLPVFRHMMNGKTDLFTREILLSKYEEYPSIYGRSEKKSEYPYTYGYSDGKYEYKKEDYLFSRKEVYTFHPVIEFSSLDDLILPKRK